jgi:hypothetical protein
VQVGDSSLTVAVVDFGSGKANGLGRIANSSTVKVTYSGEGNQ